MTTDLVVSKDSNGDYTCPVCGKCYLQEALALECLGSHEGDRDVLVLDRVRVLATPVNQAFGSFDGSANTIGINERLVSLMFEDYLLSREQDIVGRGKVSPLSMQLSKNLNDAVTNLNKLKYGTKSLSVSVKDQAGPTEAMDILKDVVDAKVTE